MLSSRYSKYQVGNPVCEAGLVIHKDGNHQQRSHLSEILLPLQTIQNWMLPLQPQKLEQWQKKPWLHEIQDHPF